MSAPDPSVPRLLECGNAVKLASCSHLAMRVYLHLFWGEDSEKPGFGRCSRALLAETLGSSARAVEKALNELQSVDLIVWSDDERLAYRPGFALRFNPRDWSNHASWYDTAARLRDGVIASQVSKDIGPRGSATKAATDEATKAATAGLLSVSSIASVSSMPPTESISTPPPAKRTREKREPADPFQEPTLEETTAHFALWLRDRPELEAQSCILYWRREEWTRKGGKPIKDWKGTCHMWALNAIKRGAAPVAGSVPVATPQRSQVNIDYDRYQAEQAAKEKANGQP